MRGRVSGGLLVVPRLRARLRLPLVPGRGRAVRRVPSEDVDAADRVRVPALGQTAVDVEQRERRPVRSALDLTARWIGDEYRGAGGEYCEVAAGGGLTARSEVVAPHVVGHCLCREQPPGLLYGPVPPHAGEEAAVVRGRPRPLH